MVDDFRSDRMPTPEGKGNARKQFERAWAAYAKGVNKIPGVRAFSQGVAGAVAVDLLGFWLGWQVEGGFEGMRRLGMSRSAIYRRIRLFRKATGLHPDEYQMPGVTIDVAAYVAGTSPAKGG
jgi:hypothetical protein